MNDMDLDLDLNLDLDLDLDEVENVEIIEPLETFNDSSIEEAKEIVEYSLDRLLRVKALNHTLSNIVATREHNLLKKGKEYIESFDYTSANHEEGSLRRTLETVNRISDLVREELTKLNNRSVVDLSRINMELAYLKIPDKFITKNLNDCSIGLRQIVNGQFGDNLNDPTIVKHIMIYLANINYELALIKGSIEGTFVNAPPGVVIQSSDVDMVGDTQFNLSEFSLYDKGNIYERYQIPWFRVDKEIQKLMEIRDLLDKADIPAIEIPNIYTVRDMTVYEDAGLTEVDAVLRFSKKDAPMLIKTHIRNEVENFLAVMTFSTRRYDMAQGRRDIPTVYTEYYESLLKELGINGKEELHANILEYTPIYVDGDNIILFDPDGRLSAKTMLEYKPFRTDDYLTILDQLRTSRDAGHSSSFVYVSAISSKDTNYDFLEFKETEIGKELKAPRNRYTNEELFKMAFQRGLKTAITVDNSFFDNAISKEVKATINELGLTENLVPNKGLNSTGLDIINNLIPEFEKANMQVSMNNAKLLYSNNKLYEKYGIDFIMRAEQEALILEDILGEYINLKTYYDLLDGVGTIPEEMELKKGLKTTEITSVMWMMILLYSEGLSPSHPLTRDNIVVDINGTGTYENITPTEYTRFVLKALTKERPLEEVWGLRLKNEVLRKSHKFIDRVRRMLAHAYHTFRILSRREEMFDVTNLVDNKDLESSQGNIEKAEQYGLDPEFLESYQRLLNKQINAILASQKGRLTLPREVDINDLSDLLIKSRWETRNKSKDFSHQLADLTAKPRRTISQIYAKANAESREVIPQLMELRDMVDEDPTGTINKFLQITNNTVSQENPLLNKLIIQMVYRSAEDITYLFDLYEYLTIFEDGILDAFNEEHLSDFYERSGLDKCNKIPTEKDVLDSLNKTKENISNFANRDSLIISHIINRRFVRLLERETSEEELLEYIKTRLEDLKKVGARFEPIIVNEKDREYFSKSIPVLTETMPHWLDMACELRDANTTLTSTPLAKEDETSNLLMLDLERKDAVKITAEINSLSEQITLAKARQRYLIVLSKFFPRHLLKEVELEIEELELQREQLKDKHFKKVREVNISPDAKKKSIALYKLYLQKGDKRYLDEVNFDALPFSLLTKERTVNDKTDAHYSKSYLNQIYNLGLNTKSSLITEDFEEIFEMILEEESTFIQNAPLAIVEYMAETEEVKRMIEANFNPNL